MATTVKVNDQATPAVRKLITQLGTVNVGNRVGRYVTNLVKDHLFKYNAAHPNRLGGKRTNFYSQAAKLTSYSVTGEGAKITIAQVGMRQRYEGGTITPKNGPKWLTIPAVAAAHGRRASEFDNLRFVQFSPVLAALVEAKSTAVKLGGKRKDGTRKFINKGQQGGGVMFWLKKSVTQSGDPGVIPTEKQIVDTAIEAILAT